MEVGRNPPGKRWVVGAEVGALPLEISPSQGWPHVTMEPDLVVHRAPKAIHTLGEAEPGKGGDQSAQCGMIFKF